VVEGIRHHHERCARAWRALGRLQVGARIGAPVAWEELDAGAVAERLLERAELGAQRLDAGGAGRRDAQGSQPPIAL
jgi:hypothetical protein